jgi:hypothetical protein
MQKLPSECNDFTSLFISVHVALLTDLPEIYPSATEGKENP